MKYRDHKGGFSESMETVIIVNSKDDIINHLNEFYKYYGRYVEDIKFAHIGIDPRNNWDTFYVLQRLNKDVDFAVAGMSDGEFI